MPHVRIDTQRTANAIAALEDKRDLYGLLELAEAKAKACGVKAGKAPKADPAAADAPPALNYRNLANFIEDCHEKCEAFLPKKPTPEQKANFDRQQKAHIEQHKQLGELLALLQGATKRVKRSDARLAKRLKAEQKALNMLDRAGEVADRASRPNVPTSIAGSQQRIDPVPRQQPY